MLEFRCHQCNSVITVPDDTRNKIVSCYNCPAKNQVPEEAAPEQDNRQVSALPVGISINSLSSASISAPAYPLANFLGAIFIVLGLVGAVTCLFLGIAIPALFLGVPSSLTFSAIGIVMHLLRAIAIDVRRLRDA